MSTSEAIDGRRNLAGRAAVVARQLIRSEACVFQLRASDKHRVLEELARRASAELGIASSAILRALSRQEELGSTGVGRGVAIPHARMDEVREPFGLFAILKPPVRFDALDGKPVDLLFMLLLPGRMPGGQIGSLACAARSLRDPARAEQLRGARGSLSVYSILTGA